MNAVNIILQILLLVAGIFLVVAVLLQRSKAKGLSGAIAGGVDTFFGKEQGPKMDKLLNRLTMIIAIVFVVLIVIVYVIQPDYASSTFASSGDWTKISEYGEAFEHTH